MADGWETARRLDRPPILEVRGGNVFKTGVTGWQGTDGLSLGYGRQCEAQPSEGGTEGTARGTGWTVRQQEGQ